MARSMPCQIEMGSLPSTISERMPYGRARSATGRSAWTVFMSVEMPQRLLVTIMSTGSSRPGWVDQFRHVSKSPSAVPASPPITTVMPSPPCRFCIRAVPGAIENCTSITLVTGSTFHSGAQ
jgi:hypothetical protein